MLRKLSLGLVVGLCMVGNALAHSPEDVAERCANKVEQVVERATNAAQDETHECVRRINALQDEGRDEAAKRVARECITNATERTHNAVRYVNAVCDECVEVLLRLDAPQLARRINHLCDEAVETLRVILHREKNAILDALED
ncbi:MAG: hypothetical protein H8E66_23405 [Planctomycetes bacterium]|nr:hypothetical protein [Planctomycetota bacterium]